MEDAMIINKSSFDRGFGDGCVYKASIIDLTLDNVDKEHKQYFSNMDSEGMKFEKNLDDDGLPFLGQKLIAGDPYYCVFDEAKNKHEVHYYKGKETAFVDELTVLGMGKSRNEDIKAVQKAGIKLRFSRRPTRGDKFSSRHGQKGVLSRLIPQVDLPFTESGMTPDIIINPHAFPSRMTIGMLVESMAGKSGSLHGIKQDGTPFQFSEENTAVDHAGTQLVKAGFNYYGNEVMYSGITGEEFQTEIFIGVVYYQRLRHMVSDKYQVRSTGPRNKITRQPVKGRKRGGGIRFGEMERDSLLAHGVSYLLHDRLMNCSDIHTTHICSCCGSILSIVNKKKSKTGELIPWCNFCNSSRDIKVIVLPFVFRYLTNELAAMNIRLSIDVKKIGEE
jgi:DNA-directed RNA polymerase I subunit RPA2